MPALTDRDEERPDPEPPKKKRKKARKKKKAHGGAERPEEATATERADAEQDRDAPKGERKAGKRKGTKQDRDGPGRWVWLALLVIAVVEVWLFGNRGHIEVCVGREGEHDFALLGSPRNEDNTRRYPTCEKRLNVGITSHFDEARDDAMIHACRRATILRGREVALKCALAIEGWEHRLSSSWCPPWHDHYYQRLFWFLDGD
jgi:hypothetical protein